MRTHQALIAAAGAVVLVILILLGVGLANRGDDQPAGRGADFVAAIEKAQDAVVVLGVPGGGGAADAMPMGSGIVVSPDGVIVTSAHVTGGLPVVNVIFLDGTSRRAELIGTDAGADVAVFRTPAAKPLAYLPLGDSSQVKAGQPVVLMGAPFGLSGTATSGIVSAVGRRLDSDGPGLIQTDAALTAGGSGGPLLNARGQVIGLASAKLSRGEPGAGLAFATPSNVVKTVVDHFAPPAKK
jgi:S1-C subfamily serine protease